MQVLIIVGYKSSTALKFTQINVTLIPVINYSASQRKKSTLKTTRINLIPDSSLLFLSVGLFFLFFWFFFGLFARDDNEGSEYQLDKDGSEYMQM